MTKEQFTTKIEADYAYEGRDKAFFSTFLATIKPYNDNYEGAYHVATNMLHDMRDIPFPPILLYKTIEYLATTAKPTDRGWVKFYRAEYDSQTSPRPSYLGFCGFNDIISAFGYTTKENKC